MGEDTTLSSAYVIREALSVSETKKIDDVRLLMKRKQIHLATVFTQHKKIVGIVTLEDIIESLVGEIEDEFDKR